MPVYWAGVEFRGFWDGSPIHFTLTVSTADQTDPIDWGALQAALQPPHLSADVWATVFANFVAQPPAQVHLTASVTGSGTITGSGLSCGETATTCDVMVAIGTTVTLTATPAGATRFMTWGGGCSGNSNTCQLTLQSDTQVTADFQSEVIALAPNDGTNNAVIALNSTLVFWPRIVNGSEGIWSAAKNGGTPVRLATAPRRERKPSFSWNAAFSVKVER